MKLNNARYIWIVVFLLALVLAGCSSAEKTAEITGEVIAEKDVSCPFEGYTDSSGVKLIDPELGETDRGWVSRWEFACDEPYIKGKVIGFQDGRIVSAGYDWTGYYEIATDEGGVWRGLGTGKHHGPEGSGQVQVTLQGDGLYKGLTMIATLDKKGNVKFKVIKPDTVEATPLAGTGTLVVENEATCPPMRYITQDPIATTDNSDLGSAVRGLRVQMNYNCPEPYLRGKTFSVVDVVKDGDPWAVTQFMEIVTIESGVWKGMCIGEQPPDADHPNKGTCNFTGESVYKGMNMVMSWDGDQVKIKVTKLEE